jgi:hypothetical protein
MKLRCDCVVLIDDDGECFTLYSCAYDNPWQEDELDIAHNATMTEIKSLKDSFFEDLRQNLSSWVSDSHSMFELRRSIRKLTE